MASIVIGPLMICRRPLTPSELLLLYFAVMWEYDMLETTAMNTSDSYELAQGVQYVGW